MENETKKSIWKKYLLYSIGGILFIFTMIQYSDAIVSGTTYTTYYFLQTNSSNLGAGISARGLQNQSFTNITTHNVRTQNVSLGTVVGVAKYFSGPFGNTLSSATGNGTFVTSNFSIPEHSYQAINGTWEASVLGDCSLSTATAVVQFILFKLNKTATGVYQEWNLTAISSPGANAFKGAVNASVADACGAGALSSQVSQNLTIIVPAQFDTGFTNLSGDDRIGVRVAILQSSTTSAGFNISMNNTGSFLKIPNLTISGSQWNETYENYSSSYGTVNITNFNKTIINTITSTLIITPIISGLNLTQKHKYREKDSGKSVLPYFTANFTTNESALSYKSKMIKVDYILNFTDKNISAVYNNTKIYLSDPNWFYNTTYWCDLNDEQTGDTLNETILGNITARNLIGQFTVNISVDYNFTFNSLRANKNIKCFDPVENQGPNNGNSFGNETSIGTVAWSNPTNAQTSNNVYATAILVTDAITNYLNVTNFTFSIPTGATINGINVTIERKETGVGGATDNSIVLIKNGVIGGTDKADLVTSWPTTDAYATYGNDTDLWGNTWNSSDINDRRFGVGVSAIGVLASTVSIDHIRMQVFYTNASTSSCTYTSGNYNLKWYDNCTITSNINLQGNNLTIDTCPGTLTILGGNITNYYRYNRYYQPTLTQACLLNNYAGSIRR